MVYNPAGSLFSLPSRIAIANFESFSPISIANSLCKPSEIKALAEGQKEVCFLIFAQIPARLRNLRGGHLWCGTYKLKIFWDLLFMHNWPEMCLDFQNWECLVQWPSLGPRSRSFAWCQWSSILVRGACVLKADLSWVGVLDWLKS